MSNIILPGGKQAPKLTKTQRLHKEIEQLERELNSAKCLLWAAIKTAGGRVDIPKSMMEKLDGDNELEARYDPKENTTILQAKIKGEK